jgi:DHA2 family multidrug resistance protein
MSAEAPAATFQSDEDFVFDLHRFLLVVAVMTSVLLEIIDTSIVNVALPSMMGNLGATLDEADWVITGYIISNVCVIPMTSWLAARFGRKRYFVSSILLFTTASLLCGLSSSIPELVLWRIVQGLGGGALLATAQSVLVESFPASRQGQAQAIFGVGAMLGPSLGPTLGGWLTDTWSWHWIFLVNVPIGLVAATLCMAELHDPEYLRHQRPKRVDWPGIALLVIGIGALQTVLERGNKEDWFASPLITGLALTSVVALVALVVRELTTEHPVIDLRVLRHRALAVGCVLGALMGIVLYGSVFLFPVYSQSLLGWTAWNSGLAILPSSFATAIMMLVVGRAVWRVGPRVLFLTGMVVTIAALLFMSDWTLQSGWDQIWLPQALRGIGMGLMFVPLSTATLRALPPEDVPKGAGLYNLFRQLGGSIGIASLATLLDHRAEVHRALLSAHVGPYDPVSAERLRGMAAGLALRGLDPQTAHRTAAAILDRLLEARASMLAFEDAYLLMAGLFVVLLPFGFAVARRAPGREPEPAQRRDARARGFARAERLPQRVGVPAGDTGRA